MGKLPTASAPADGAALDRAIRHLLRPLVRLLLARGIPYPALAAMLKDVYFEVAVRDVARGEAQTTSRISLITGLHRKDVRRMRDAGAARPAVALETRLASEVFTRWISDARFLDARKRPRRLARLASAGGVHSFESLAASVSSDVRPRALLDELLRLGLVTLDAGDHVALNRHAFVPARGSEEVLHYFGHNVHDHLAAAVHNILGLGPGLLEQGVFGDRLSAESVDAIGALVRDAWARMLREIVPAASELDVRDARSGNADMRMRFGVYFFAEPLAAATGGAGTGNEPEQLHGRHTLKAHTPDPRSGKRRRKSRAHPARPPGR